MTSSLGFMGKLSKPEKQGDLGFSDLNSFNLAMQARQAWSILQKTSSLSVKVLSAKNYQGNSILQPTPGNGTPSVPYIDISDMFYRTEGVFHILGIVY
jgi:hypothetical protein